VAPTAQASSPAPAEPAPAAPAAAADEEPVEIGGPPLLRVGSLGGATPEQAGEIFAPVVEQLEGCASGAERGVLHVRLSVERSRTAFRVDPATTRVASATRECVLQALSALDERALGHSTSPSEATPVVESQLVVSW
jgi:hypothetical protein